MSINSHSGSNPSDDSRKDNSREDNSRRDQSVPNVDSSETERSFLIVGIGASAGGLEAFQTFFRHMDSSQNMAFVLISHLSPDHESMLSELLAKETQMPVLQVQESVAVERGHVYVIPPNADLKLKQDVLHLSEPVQTRGHRVPINVFFQSLAEEQRENAVCIVLSGTGSDGTLGLKAIKEFGGLAIAQDSKSAKYDSMPRNAAHTGLVDYVLSVEDIPAKLVEYARHREALRARLGEDGMFADTANHLRQICSLLQRRVGHDFNGYKRNTLVRRIQRRIQITQKGSVGAYVKYLRSDNDELTLLFKDLLIGVTHFFRNLESFEMLGSCAIASLVENAVDSRRPIRVWVTGCSSGEEAYSIAMLLSEEINKQKVQASVQIFATDIDERALDVARQARYPESIVEQISPERLERFFIQHNGGYQVTKHLREMCIFSQHNLISDPPFSNLHLISCRNLLIYLDNELQRKVIPLFHYALQPDGYLFLGSSENLTGQSDLFRTTDKQHRIFQKKQAVISPRIDFPLADRSSYRQSNQSPLNPPAQNRQQQVNRLIERVMLQDYAPACVIINEQNDIVYFFGRTGNYLEPSQGVPSNNLFDLARRGLGLDLRAAIQSVRETQRPSVRERVSFEMAEQVHLIDLVVRALSDNREDDNLLMVIFRNLNAASSYDQKAIRSEAEGESQVVQQLERELRATKDHLRSTIEELETSNEELKSANEELLSMNEELQSSNEELQTSKEEMQSINEELETVNAELRNKIDELDAVNSDLRNLFESTQIATIFLTQSLEIKKFTPAANSIFNFLETDIGRPITDMALSLSDVDVAADARQVLQSLVPVEREVQLEGRDTFYKMRVLPYRTLENVIDGAVITFVDVSDLRQAKHRAERSAQRQQAIAELGLFALQNSDIQAVCDRAVEIACSTLSSDFCSLFVLTPTASGDTALTLKSTSGFELTLPDADRSLPRYVLSINNAVIVDDFSKEVRFTPVSQLDRWNITSGVSTIIYGADSPYGVFTSYSDQVSAFTTEDVSFLQAIANELAAALQREQVTQALTKNQTRLDLALDAGQMGVWEYFPSSGLATWNATGYILLGLTPETSENPSSRFFLSFVHPDDADRAHQTLEAAIEQCSEYSDEFRINRADDGQLRWIAAQAKVITDEQGAPIKIVGVTYDITDRKQIEADLQAANQRKNEFLAILSHELRNPLNAIINSLEMMKISKRTDRLDQFHAIATRQLRQFTRLIDDLLDISRIIHGKIQIQLEAVNLSELLQNMLDDTQESWSAKSLNVQLALPEQPIWIDGDPVRLSQAFSNVMRNAIKFSQRDGSILLGARLEAQQVIVSISDTGIGLAPGAQSRIFETFSQEAGSASMQTGLGLGLPLAKGIIELHDGHIRAESPGLNQGTTFRVQLPYSANTNAEAARLSKHFQRETAPDADKAATAADSLSVADRLLRVLVIEDDADASEVLRFFLSELGCEVATALSGESGLEQAQQFRPDVVVSDIGLSNSMSGYDVARAIRADDALSQPYLVAASGYGRTEDKEAAQAAGFDQHLTKPIDLARMQQIIQQRISALRV